MKEIGVAICGSFCTFDRVLSALEELKKAGFGLVPILSYSVAQMNTRFYEASEFRKKVEEITGKRCVDSIVAAEPLGTSKKVDAILVAPCTGNTLSKIANGITDTPVTMAVKAHLRNGRPVIISLSSNDALGANAKNLGVLLNTKNVYFVPFGQDDPMVKSKSLIADTTKILPATQAALEGRQLQPVFLSA